MSPLLRKCVAEFLGSAFLIATVIGSGIMATNLTDNVALQLLCNTVAKQLEADWWHSSLLLDQCPEHISILS